MHRFLIVLSGLLLNVLAIGQSISDHNWIFGTVGEGIRFNIGDNSANRISGKSGLGLGGGAVATNPYTGDIMFYTDGATVYDASNAVMSNGNGLTAATSSTQAVAISAVPGTTSQYYIFTNTATPAAPGVIRYSIVDMSLAGNAVAPVPNLGAVTVKNQVVNGALTNVAQGMVVVANSNCDGFWLIAQNSGTDSYYVAEISAAGIPGNITTYGGIGLPIEAAAISYNEATNKLAVAPEDIENNVVILDFDPATGGLTFSASVLNTGRMVTGNESVYDVEWSPSGNYLYVSILGEAGITAELFQYDVVNPSTSLATVPPFAMYRSYGLKVAADTAIYHLFQTSAGGAFQLGRIVYPDSVASKIVYDVDPFIVGNYNARHFSSSLPPFDAAINATIDVAGTCANVPSLFSAELYPGADSVRWDFGDGNSSTELSPIYSYQNGGAMNVQLTTFHEGKQQVFTSSVNISIFNLQINLVQDTVGCKCEFPANLTAPECAGASTFFSVTADIQGGSPTSILWSNGDTGPTLSPDSAGYYYVVVTDASGCSAYAGVNIREYDAIDLRSAVWYFGQNAGINFNTYPNPPVALNDGLMVAPEGSSTISNRNGELIFYTDGDKVWDKNHVEIAAGIGGETGSTNSALIVPVPGDETLYYIFTTQEVFGSGTYEVRYSIFDVKQRSGDGDLVVVNKLLFSRSTERLASNNGWLVAHEYGNSIFRAYPISVNGIGMPVISDVGSAHDYTIAGNGQGYMKFSSTGKLAVALSNPGVYNYIELFDFDSGSGTIDNFQQLTLAPPTGQVYGVEFSPGGNKLFATITDNPSTLVEYFIDSIGVAYFRQSLTPNQELGAIQTAPSGQLFVAVNGSSSLGLINVNEDTTMNSSYLPVGFALAGGTNSTLGLPSFVQSLAAGPMTPTILVDGTCFGSETTFLASGTDIIDNFSWNFGDGTNGTGIEATHTYGLPGTYNVSVQITNRCGLNMILTQQVVISDSPTLPTIPATANLCTGSVTLTAASPADPQFPGYTYLWSTGETTNSIVISEPRAVSVVITNASGCTSTRQSLVVDNRPFVDFGPDLTVCQNQTVLALDAGNVGATYSWKLNGAASGISQTRTVSTAVPGSFNFEVTVTDPLTGCVTVEDIIYTVEAIPVFTVTPTPSPGCNANSGTIDIEITTEGSYTYYINGPDFRTNINQLVPTGGSTIISETLLPVGTYFVTIYDEVSSCQVIQQVLVEDQGTTMIIPTPVSLPGCGVIELEVDIQDGTYDGSAGFNYILTNLDNTVVTNGTSAVEPIITTPVIPGNYSLSVEDIATTCTQVIGPFVVSESTPALLSISSIEECANPVAVTATSDATSPQYNWVGPNGFTAVGATINPTEEGDYFVTVTDLTNDKCPSTETAYIYANAFVPVINVIGDPCLGSVLLEVEPLGGNYSYLWSGPSSGGQQLLIGPTESGTYTVTVRDQNTGCQKTSEPVNVTVIEPLTLSVSSELACDNGEPFTITATSSPGVNFSWYRNDILLTNEVNSSIDVKLGGIYTVKVEKQGCALTEDIDINLLPFESLNLPVRVSICDDPDNPDPSTAIYYFGIGGKYTSYNWEKDGLPVSNDPNFIATESGVYQVEVINSFGCTGNDQTTIVSICDPIISAPNAFSPNGNAQNDEFFIFTNFLTDEFEVKIYNRWGELVFQSIDKDFRWNGRYNNGGELLPGGTYVYVMSYVSEYQQERGKQEKRGGVVLLR